MLGSPPEHAIGVPAAGPGGGAGRWAAGATGRREAAQRAGAAALTRERGRPQRAADRPDLGRVASADRRDRSSGLRVPAAQGDRARPRVSPTVHRHAASRLHRPLAPGQLDLARFEQLAARAARSSPRGPADRRRPTLSPKRSHCGGAGAGEPAQRGVRPGADPPARGAARRRRRGPRRGAARARTPPRGRSPSSRRWSPSIRCASACEAS